MLKLNSKIKTFSILTFLLILLSNFLSVKAYNNNYYIKNYNVDIEVREDNSYYIIETIDAYFDIGANKHGIIRNIPLKNNIYREDGSTGTTRAKISDIKVKGAPYSISDESSEIKIKIGSASEVVEGDVRYEISYLYELGNDILKGKDEFYFNIIGNKWDTDIEAVEFTIRFPKEFDYSKLGFTKGVTYSNDFSGVMWRVENNIVYGYTEEPLKPYNALTMRLELPDGYFLYRPTFLDKFGDFLMAIPMFMLGLIYYIYRKYAKNEEPVEPIEFYPPDNLNPLEIGYYYDATLDNKDITSLLIYLANEGYLKIEEYGKHDYRLILLKDAYEGNNLQEKEFYESLLRKSKNGIVEETDLTNRFYTTVSAIRTQYDTRKRKRSILVPTGHYQAFAVIIGLLMMLLSLFMLLYYQIYNVGDSIAISLGVTVMTVFYTPFIYAAKTSKNIFIKIIVFGILTVHFIIIFALFRNILTDLYINDKFHAILGVIGFFAGLFCVVLSFMMFKRTDYGNLIYGRIKGFRNFLETAEKEKLEMLVNENPSYFYDILPYAHVLGVSNKWIKKFDDIAMPPPSWYDSPNAYDNRHYHNKIEDSLNSLSHNMTSSPTPTYSSSGSSGGYSSSSSSGGGSSGGGSGGGGGSSW